MKPAESHRITWLGQKKWNLKCYSIHQQHSKQSYNHGTGTISVTTRPLCCTREQFIVSSISNVSLKQVIIPTNHNHCLPRRSKSSCKQRVKKSCFNCFTNDYNNLKGRSNIAISPTRKSKETGEQWDSLVWKVVVSFPSWACWISQSHLPNAVFVCN